MAIREAPARLAHAVDWLIAAHGREANWFWRLKFQKLDQHVRFDQRKYGWSWVPGTTSWVIPTSFSVIALSQAKNRGIKRADELAERIETGTSMLIDRMCPGGGWNAGNGFAFGVVSNPHVDATSVALLALRGQVDQASVQTSLAWLVNRLPECPSPYSTAWGILGLAAYQGLDRAVDNTIRRAENRLITLLQSPRTDDAGTLGICALALGTADGENAFEVLA